MNRERWCTKEDVLKDLAVATGTELNIDNSYFVVGERPPPRYFTETDDDEMELMFRDAITEKPVDVVISPDLRGITQMIRMVQGYDDTSSNSDTKVGTTRPESPCNVISISKLNPNVKEFKPRERKNCAVANKTKGNTSPAKTKASTESSDSTSSKIESGSGKGVVKVKEEVCSEQTGFSKNEILRKELDSNKANAQEPKDVAAELRNKIQQPKQNGVSKFQMKKERNVAIASLQKLLSMQANNETKDTIETVKPIKLITPDYYAHTKAEASDEEAIKNKLIHGDKIIDSLSNESILSSRPSGSSYQVLKKILHDKLNADVRSSSEADICNVIHYTNSEQKASSSASENKIDRNVSDEKLCSDTNLSDPQIRDSIKKVNNWMNKNDGKPEEKTHVCAQVISPTPPVFLSTITFKRKETRNSPNVSEKNVSKPLKNRVEEYKPSEYAQELSKMYTERVKKIESTKVKNGWANLEELLKEKDEKIKREKLKASDSQ